jgi:acylphosphatase
MIRRRFCISGRVQGVGYRAFAVRTAAGLGLGGFVANLADGRVLCEAEGAETAVEAFAAALRRGPAFARVDRVTAETAPPSGERTFTVRG